jgi:hypothetical protein
MRKQEKKLQITRFQYTYVLARFQKYKRVCRASLETSVSPRLQPPISVESFNSKYRVNHGSNRLRGIRIKWSNGAHGDARGNDFLHGNITVFAAFAFVLLQYVGEYRLGKSR